MPKNRGTDYAETEALLAALSDDEEGVEQWLGELLPGERASLDHALTWMSRTIMRLRQQDHANGRSER